MQKFRRKGKFNSKESEIVEQNERVEDRRVESVRELRTFTIKLSHFLRR
jgi:hypothetical protein